MSHILKKKWENSPTRPLPLSGVRVLEFTQLIMGPTTGMVLADLGADVIKVEAAPDGDPTRTLTGFTSGFSDYFNRNKRSVSINLKRPESQLLINSLCTNADVLIENFAPGKMKQLGYGYDSVCIQHPRLIYCALKGFLPGPYENRTALDEAVQFMGGLAYMTGPPGQPLRSGTSVVDLMGGTMAAVAIMAALAERDRTGKGQLVQTGLFESVAFMMGQHMAAVAIEGHDLPPMPVRKGGWGIYQLFKTKDDSQIFLAVTNDSLWQRFCVEFNLQDLRLDERLKTNIQRIAEREWLIPRVAATITSLSANEVANRCDRGGIPFADVATSKSLFTDRHLVESGALLEIVMRNGIQAGLPSLPILLDGRRLGVRLQPPKVGQHTREIFKECGFNDEQINVLEKSGVIVAP